MIYELLMNIHNIGKARGHLLLFIQQILFFTIQRMIKIENN